MQRENEEEAGNVSRRGIDIADWINGPKRNMYSRQSSRGRRQLGRRGGLRTHIWMRWRGQVGVDRGSRGRGGLQPSVGSSTAGPPVIGWEGGCGGGIHHRS